MVPEIKRFSWIVRLMAVTAGLILGLGACSGLPVEKQRTDQLGPAERQQLNNSLNVASASADAGQLQAAERLYTQLSRHFPSLPEPKLGLGYLALEAGDFTLAEKLFTEADQRSATPAARAEALLGVGRTNLGKGDTAGAKNHFLAASKLAKGTRVEAWVANGLGVVATLEGNHTRARTHYEEAFKLSPSHPMITANLVRSLAQSGAGNEATRLYTKYPASHWLDGDGAALSSLLETRKGAAAASGAKVQLYSARSHDRALATWGRLASEEKELLGSLSHRVVKAEVPKNGAGGGDRSGRMERTPDAPPGRPHETARFQPVTEEPPRDAPQANTAAAASGAKVQLYSARSRDRALATWGRLASEEKELLGSLSHRVVKAEVPKSGAGGGDRSGRMERTPDAPPGRPHETARFQPVTEEPPRDAPQANTAAAASGAKVQLYSARSRDRALAAWGRLASEEKELLGSLSHRVVKAQIPKRGLFYRLRAGPLADKAAAKRMCGLLKGRGRDCFVLAGKWTRGDGTRGAEKSPDAPPGRPHETARSQPVTEEPSRETPEAATVSGAKVQLFSARSRDRALAAWGRLASEEKELLGSLSHRVVKAQIPKRGLFYRLWAGPLADKAAAKRMCSLLKGRGRDCFVLAGKWAGGGGAGAAEKSPDAPPGRPHETARSRPVTEEPARETPEAATVSGAKVQLYSARSRDRALAAWGRLASEEKEMLGSLTHGVLKAQIPNRGVFYRLWAGPLADKTAAKRLCGVLKGRGRDCFVLAGR